MSDELFQSKKQRLRSPAYPAIDLGEALDKASILWNKAKRNHVGINEAVRFWGYESSSSSGHSALSALKKFGLLEEQGVGDSREVKLTDFAIRLVFNPHRESEEYQNSLKEAALRPAIHAELWKKYGGELPDDAIIERYLVLDRGFNPQYVKPFIKQFKTTILFAALTAFDILSEQQDQDSTMLSENITSKGSISETSRISAKTEATSARQADGLIDIAVPLPSGALAYYRVPQKMSESDFAFYQALLTAYKTGLTGVLEKPKHQPPTEPSHEQI